MDRLVSNVRFLSRLASGGRNNGLQHRAHPFFLSNLNATECHCKQNNQCQRYPHRHFLLATDRMLFKAKHLVNSSVNALDRRAFFVRFFPFQSGPSNRCKDSPTQFQRHSYHSAILSNSARREAFAFLTSGTGKSIRCSWAAPLEMDVVLLGMTTAELLTLWGEITEPFPYL